MAGFTMAKKKTDHGDDPAPTPAAPRKRRTTRRPAAVHEPAGQPTHEQIAEAAYQRYLQRGRRHGEDVNDWVEAERALRNRST